MKVAIFSPYATVSPHFETELELIERHQRNGDVVDVVACFGELPNCDFNPIKDQARCRDCCGRRQHGFSLLGKNVRILRFTSPPTNGQVHSPSIAVTDVEQLKQLTIGNFDIGQAVLSSLISLVRDPRPDLQQHQLSLNRLLQSALAAYEATCGYLRTRSPDRVYVFNGRFAATRAVLRATQAHAIDCFVHERGCDLHHFELYKNHLPHEISPVDQAIRDAWHAAAVRSDRSEQARTWYDGRRQKVERNWHSFVKGQVSNLLPPGFDRQQRNVAIFCSSDDEFAAIGDCWRNHRFPSQFDTIRSLAGRLAAGGSDITLYLRMHPNLAATDNSTTNELLHLAASNVNVIPPADPCDSYALMEAADTTITFGSTMGIEAVYWQRPSVLLGPSFYQNLGGTYQPVNLDALVSLVSERLVPNDRIGAEMYGYWQQTHGLPFQFVEPDGLFHARFKGEVVYNKPRRNSLTSKLKRLLRGWTRSLQLAGSK